MDEHDTEEVKRKLERAILRLPALLDQSREALKDCAILTAVPELIAMIRVITTAFPQANKKFIVAALAFRYGVISSGELANTRLGLSRTGVKSDRHGHRKIGARIAKAILKLKFDIERDSYGFCGRSNILSDLEAAMEAGE